MQERNGGSFSPQAIYPKGSFNISASCPSKTDGESYEMGIILNYSMLNGGKETDYTDSGLVLGQA